MEESERHVDTDPHDEFKPQGSGNGSAPRPTSTLPSTSGKSNASLTVAVIWAIVAVIVGIKFITSAEDGAYGGAAYTDIQNMGAQTVRALGWVIISTGPLGLVTALARR